MCTVNASYESASNQNSLQGSFASMKPWELIHVIHVDRIQAGCVLECFVWDGQWRATRMKFNTMRPKQNGHRFADDTFKRIFLNENVRISIKISLKFVSKGPIDNIPALVQIMAWRRPGDKPLSEPMVISLLTRHSASMSLATSGYI